MQSTQTLTKPRPNCGDVISSLGEKECAYCGSAIEPVNIRVWHFGALHEDDD